VPATLGELQDLQNLTQRFKSKQTVSLQQAMYWADRDALIPAAAPQAAEEASTSKSIPKLAADDLPADASIQSSTSAADSSEHDTASAPAAAASKTVVGEAGSSTRQDSASSTPPEQQRKLQDITEEAVRLSFAALQGVPEENPKVSAWS
jgi:hypothetical protein